MRRSRIRRVARTAMLPFRRAVLKRRPGRLVGDEVAGIPIVVVPEVFNAGVIPEFSFVLGGPGDPEDAVEETLALIRRVKVAHPQCEVILKSLAWWRCATGTYGRPVELDLARRIRLEDPQVEGR